MAAPWAWGGATFDAMLGWLMVLAGGAIAAIGALLIYLRSRMGP